METLRVSGNLARYYNFLSNGHSTANFASANFANVASTRASTCARLCGAFRVDVVTCQTRRHSPSRVAWTRQACRHSPSRVARTRQTLRHLPSCVARTRQTCRHSPRSVARTRQTRRHSPKAIFEKNVTRLDKFARVRRESCKFGASGHSLLFLQYNKFITYLIIKIEICLLYHLLRYTVN
jgi:hypothetical protein